MSFDCVNAGEDVLVCQTTDDVMTLSYTLSVCCKQASEVQASFSINCAQVVWVLHVSLVLPLCAYCSQ